MKKSKKTTSETPVGKPLIEVLFPSEDETMTTGRYYVKGSRACKTPGQPQSKTGRDTIFVQYVGNDGSFRVALPPEVADVIARQRGSVTSKNRKTAARRKAAGIVPGFLNGKKRKAKKGE